MKKMLPVLLFLSAAWISAETVNAWLDYPVEYAQLTGAFKGAPTAKMFFESGALINRKNDNGDLAVCKVVKRTRQLNTVTYLLTSSAAGKPLVKFVVRLEINDAEESTLMSYFKVTIISNGNVVESEYDGTAESAGQVLGMFISVLQLILDVDKVNSFFQD